MRLNLIFMTLLCFTGQLFGQVEIGVKAFYSVSYAAETQKEFINLNPVQLHNIAANRGTAKKGIGVSMYTDNSKSFLMLDGAYATSGRNFALQSVNVERTILDPAVTFETQENDLRITAIAGIKLSKFKIGVGPELSYSIAKSESFSELDVIEAKDRTLRSGFNFLVGFQPIDKIHIDLKHTYIFQSVGQEFSYLGIPTDFGTNPKYIELSLGFYL